MYRAQRDQYQPFIVEKEEENRRFFGNDLNSADIERIQTRKLNETVRYVRESAPFYQRSLRDVRLPLALADLASLPMTTKEDLKQGRAELFSRPLRECDLYCETTGTTGEPAPSLRHAYDRIWMTSNWSSGWGRILGDKPRVIGIAGPTELHGMVDTFTEAFQTLGHCIAKIYPFSTKVNFKKALQVMRDLPVQIMCTTPTLMLMLARASRVYGFDLDRDFSLEHIFLTGELCTEAMCRNVSSFWRAPATNNPYASQEALGLSVGGKDGRLYTLPLSYIYEIIDVESQAPLALPGRGELVVTMIEPGARPLIRFRTGDYVELAPAGNGFALRSPTLMPLGRVKDNLDIEAEQPVSAYDFEEALLTPIDRVLNYQIVVEARPTGRVFVAELELEPGRTLTDTQADAIRRSLRDRLGAGADVRQVEKAHGASSMGALAGWKAARVNDLTRPADAERLYAEKRGEGRTV